MSSKLSHGRPNGVLDRDSYVPIAWVVRYAAAKPHVRGLEKNRQGEFVVDGNIYMDMLPQLYMVEKA